MVGNLLRERMREEDGYAKAMESLEPQNAQPLNVEGRRDVKGCPRTGSSCGYSEGSPLSSTFISSPSM